MQNPKLGGEQALLCVGTKEGKLLMIKVASTGHQKLAETKGGLSYGSITSIDVSVHSDKILAGT